jgi:hypothetical protein
VKVGDLGRFGIFGESWRFRAEVESREAIKPRLSQLDLDVRISTHLAPDILSLRFCSCDDSHGSFHVLLQGF